MMSSLAQHYRDIDPVTLQLVGGAVSAGLYCEEAEGLPEGAGPLVECFLVELFRCKLCQFTCGLKSTISSHLLLRHHPPALSYVGGAEGGVAEDRLQQGALPYQLDLNEVSKQSEEDEDFLLYNMLDRMSPPPCDISTEEGLQVAHNCEVSTLFEEGEESIFRLKGSVELSVQDLSVQSPSTQEQMAQSAHLMTLGLCRISASRPPPPAPAPPPDHSTYQSLKQSGTDDGQIKAPPPQRCRLACLLCPLTLTSQRLLDVHVRSHQAGGGFSCVHCSWSAPSWAELEPHWRSHCRRRRSQRRKRRRSLRRKETISRSIPKTQDAGEQWAEQLMGGAAEKEAELSGRQRGVDQSGGSVRSRAQSDAERKSKQEEETKTEEKTSLCCPVCHRKFSSRLTLRRHRSVHDGEKHFRCSHCPYSSRLKGSLQQHLRTHTGEKPYTCTLCTYASIDRSSLLRHQRTHSQEKPHNCHLCDYSSIQKKSLDLHVRRHHTGEVFPCGKCRYCSPDPQLLRRHLQRHHHF